MNQDVNRQKPEKSRRVAPEVLSGIEDSDVVEISIDSKQSRIVQILLKGL